MWGFLYFIKHGIQYCVVWFSHLKMSQASLPRDVLISPELCPFQGVSAPPYSAGVCPGRFLQATPNKAAGYVHMCAFILKDVFSNRVLRGQRVCAVLTARSLFPERCGWCPLTESTQNLLTYATRPHASAALCRQRSAHSCRQSPVCEGVNEWANEWMNEWMRRAWGSDVPGQFLSCRFSCFLGYPSL